MDLLVRLYDLPLLEKEIEKMRNCGVKLQHGFPPDREYVLSWVEKHTSIYAKGEAAKAFANTPASIILAVKDGDIVGYACYDATAPDFFGPTEVDKAYQGQGIGRALLIASMHALRAKGYGYAIIGSAGPVDFYKKCVGAIEIPDSDVGLYASFLRRR